MTDFVNKYDLIDFNYKGGATLNCATAPIFTYTVAIDSLF